MVYYRFVTRHGPIFIVPRDGRWIVMYMDENLGSYHRPEAAASDCHQGALFMPSNGVEFYDFEIPEEIGEWERVPIRHAP